MKRKQWEGPFKLLNTDGETCTGECNNRPKQFRDTVVNIVHDVDKPKLGMRIFVYWATDKTFYHSKIADYCERTGRHHVL